MMIVTIRRCIHDEFGLLQSPYKQNIIHPTASFPELIDHNHDEVTLIENPLDVFNFVFSNCKEFCCKHHHTSVSKYQEEYLQGRRAANRTELQVIICF